MSRTTRGPFTVTIEDLGDPVDPDDDDHRIIDWINQPAPQDEERTLTLPLWAPQPLAVTNTGTGPLVVHDAYGYHVATLKSGEVVAFSFGWPTVPAGSGQ